MDLSKISLLTRNNPKTVKGEKHGYLTAILHLKPYRFLGKNVCPFATKACVASCLNFSGMGAILKPGKRSNSIQRARKRRTRLFWTNRQLFLTKLQHEIDLHRKYAQKHGLKPCVRLNGTSDLAWERIAPDLFQINSDIQFYDYTKSPHRMQRYLNGKLPPNYHLTFSYNEKNYRHCKAVLNQGGNVAVVFRTASMPHNFMRHDVVSGDQHDLTFLYHGGIILGLKAKGKAKKDRAGFVVDV